MIISKLTYAVALGASVFANQGIGQSLPRPPHDLFAVSTKVHFSILDDPPQSQRIVSTLKVVTAGKELEVWWWASGADDATPVELTESHTVSFYPTAMGRSWEDLDRFYVAGRIGNTTFLEKWSIESDYSLSVATNATTGVRKTLFQPPTITREPMVVDPVMKNVSCITVNPVSPGGGPEEIWMMEWETRDVWVTNPSSGLRELRVSSAITAPYRSMIMCQHSSYGMVCRFGRSPWGRQASMADQNADFDFLVTYDTDLDGQIDGNEVITFDDQDTHPIYATGVLSHPWQDEYH